MTSENPLGIGGLLSPVNASRLDNKIDGMHNGIPNCMAGMSVQFEIIK